MPPINQLQTTEPLPTETQRHTEAGRAGDANGIGGNFLALLRAGAGQSDENETDGGNALPEAGSVLPPLAPSASTSLATESAGAGISAFQAGASGLAPAADDGMPADRDAPAVRLPDLFGGGSRASVSLPGPGSPNSTASPAITEPASDRRLAAAVTASGHAPVSSGPHGSAIVPANIDVLRPGAVDLATRPGVFVNDNGIRIPVNELAPSIGPLRGLADLKGAAAPTSGTTPFVPLNAAAGLSSGRDVIDVPPTANADLELAAASREVIRSMDRRNVGQSATIAASNPLAATGVEPPVQAVAGADRLIVRSGPSLSAIGSSSRGEAASSRPQRADDVVKDVFRHPESSNTVSATTRIDDGQSIAERDYFSSPSRTAPGHATAQPSIDIEPASLASTNPRSPADVASPALFRPVTPTSVVGQPINIPVQQPGWDNAVAERVLLMAHGRLQNAELRLSPAELGPVRIHLSIDDGVASVSFHAQQALTRDAIEQAMPRLRDMLAENGLSLGQSDVSDGGVPRETHDGGERRTREEPVAEPRPGSGGHVPSNAAAQPGDGRVDTFA